MHVRSHGDSEGYLDHIQNDFHVRIGHESHTLREIQTDEKRSGA